MLDYADDVLRKRLANLAKRTQVSKLGWSFPRIGNVQLLDMAEEYIGYADNVHKRPDGNLDWEQYQSMIRNLELGQKFFFQFVEDRRFRDVDFVLQKTDMAYPYDYILVRQSY